MIDIEKAKETAALLREAADLYEKMGVDSTIRGIMREAATIIEELLAERHKGGCGHELD